MCHRLLPQQVRQFCATVHIGRRNHQPRPAAERQHHLEHRGIEARRRKREHTCIGCHTEPVSLLLREVRKPAVGDHNTLRHTRRTGRVNQVRRIIERRNRQHNRIQISCSRIRFAVQQQPLHTRTSLGKHRDVLRDGHTHHNTGIGKHMRHTIDRIRRIHRQERSTGLRHRPHRNNRLHRTTQPQRHERTHTHTTRGQQPSQLRRTSIQLAIRNRHITRHQRHSIDTSNSNRRSKHLRQQPTRHRHTTTHRHQHRTLGLRQQLDVARDCCRGVRRCREQPDQALGMCRDGFLGCRVFAVGEFDGQTGGDAQGVERLFDVHDQVGPTEVFGRVGATEGQQNSDEVGTTRCVFTEGLGHRLERHVGMVEGCGIDATKLRRNIAEGVRRMNRAAKGDDVLPRGRGAGTDHYIRFTGHASEEHGQCRVYRYQDARVLGGGGSEQRAMKDAVHRGRVRRRRRLVLP